MARINRIFEIDGISKEVPQYVNRTVSGWQVRVRGVPSQHFADAIFGGPVAALKAASKVVEDHLRLRDSQQ